jgi:stage III sporulation protein AC
MDVELIFKVCGVAMVVTFVCHLMSKAGKDDQSAMVSLLGVVLILIILAEKIGVLVNTLKEVFGI